MMPVIGLARMKGLYFSGIVERGYMIGVAYIINCTPKERRKVRSRYFAVYEEIAIRENQTGQRLGDDVKRQILDQVVRENPDRAGLNAILDTYFTRRRDGDAIRGQGRARATTIARGARPPSFNQQN